MSLTYALSETLIELANHWIETKGGAQGKQVRLLSRVAPLLPDLAEARDVLLPLLVVEAKTDLQFEDLVNRAQEADRVHDVWLTICFRAFSLSADIAAALGEVARADILRSISQAIFQNGEAGAELSYRQEVDKALSYKSRLPPGSQEVLNGVQFYGKPLQYWLDRYEGAAKALDAVVGDRDDLDPQAKKAAAKAKKVKDANERTRPQKLMAARGALVRHLYDIREKIERHGLTPEQREEILGPFLAEEAACLARAEAERQNKTKK